MRTLAQLKDERRTTGSRRHKQSMYGHHWKQLSRQWRAENPLCVTCKAAGKIVPATVTDHIRPHGGDLRLFWSLENLQSLCDRCHNRKSREEQG